MYREHVSSFCPTPISTLDIITHILLVKVHLRYNHRDTREQPLTRGWGRLGQRSTHSGESFNMECLDSWPALLSLTAVKWPGTRQAVGSKGLGWKIKKIKTLPKITPQAKPAMSLNTNTFSLYNYWNRFWKFPFSEWLNAWGKAHSQNTHAGQHQEEKPSTTAGRNDMGHQRGSYVKNKRTKEKLY